MSSLPDPSTDARVALLQGLIDDAGIFPPARKPMRKAIRDHLVRRSTRDAWVQGVFLCLASRLEELVHVIPPGVDRLVVGVVTDGPARMGDWAAGVRSDLMQAAALEERSEGLVRVQALEIKLDSVSPQVLEERVRELASAVSSCDVQTVALDLFLEIPLTDEWQRDVPALIEALVAERAKWPLDDVAGPSAKLRCGGTTKEAFPPAALVAAFLSACAGGRLPFKATAGLHHPHPVVEPGTGFSMLGFLNLYLAAMLLADGQVGQRVATEILQNRRGSVRLDQDSLGWSDYALGPSRIHELRRDFVRGHGSCSLKEPIEDLTGLGVLPVQLSKVGSKETQQ